MKDGIIVKPAPFAGRPGWGMRLFSGLAASRRLSASGVLGVVIVGSLRDRSTGDVNRAIQATLVAARDAADWARRKLHQEIFGEYPALGGQR